MPADVVALKVQPGDGVMKVGTAVQLKLFAKGKSGRLQLITGTMAAWSSSDNQIGEVNGQGRLTPRHLGAVTITASYNAHNVTATFTVID